MNTKLSLAFAALVIAPALAAAGPADAFLLTVDAANAPSEVVRFADLDLSTRQGQDTLHHRISAAVYRVCRDVVPTPGIENAKCQLQLIQAAVDDVNTKLKLAGQDTRILR
jgi:UrcA family protein